MYSTRAYFSLFLCLSTFYGLKAQRPELVFIEGNVPLNNQRRALGCPGTEAGTITINPNPNNKSTNIQYLCAGDRLNIIHNRDARFQDPKPLTSPGSGYVFYNCKPTIDGPTLSAIVQDPCINRTTPIIVNGSPVHQLQDLWLAKGNNDLGDIEFNNDGFLQNAYNNGKPVQFWFAPITLDQFSTQAGVPQFETDANNNPGPCIDVNIDAAFSVVYLNELKISDITGVNGGQGNYTGTLTITGGLPEFDPNANYATVHIINTQDPNILGMLTNGPASHGKPMTYSVPQPGRYFITVEDGNGCPTDRYTVNIPADEGLLKIICQDGPIGQEICIPINIAKMPQLAAGQFTLLFNPQAFDFIGARNLNSKLNTTLNNVIVENQKSSGILKFLWFDLNLSAHDFTMETTLVEFCFRSKGAPGNYDFRITGSPVALEFADIGGNPYPLNSPSGSVLTCVTQINPGSNLDAYYSQCGQTMFISVFGAQPPLSVKWEQEGVPGNARIINLLVTGGRDTLFTNQPPGRYFISVTDNTGANIKDTIVFNGGLAPLALDLTTRENASCKNNDGRVAPRVLGGTPGYRYEWSNSSVDSLQTRLSIGTYTLTVTDAQGCTRADSVTINQSVVSAAIIIQTSPTCPGIDNGVLQPNFSAITGIPPFSVVWEGQGTQIGNSFRNVGERLARLIITDFRGCSDTAEIVPTALKQINIVAEVDNPRCFGIADGRLRIARSFSDGSQMTNEMVTLTRYSSGITSNDALRPAIFADLNADRYNIRVTDASGCIANLDTLLVQPPLFDTISVMITPETCFPGRDGRIEINMTGGTAPYQFIWDSAFANTNVVTGLGSGNYRVTIRDANNCISNFDTSNVLFFPFFLPSVPVGIDTTAILCNGQGTTLTARPGAGYTISAYSWSDGQTTAIAQNIKADTLTWLEVTDDKGCKGRDTVILSQPPALVWIDSITQLTDPPCPDIDQGRILVQATGGTGPYNYTLSNGTSNNFGVFDRLLAGRYMVTVVDANNCPGLVLDTLLREPPRIVAVFDTTAYKNTQCATPGDCSGQARLLLSGGTDPLNNFLVQWESGEQTLGNVVSLADSLCSGQQFVRIFDGNGCRTQLTFNINAPEAISRDAVRTTTQDLTCFDYNDGAIQYQVIGGTSPFRYLWSDSDTTSSRIGLAAGRYTVTVTDQNDCVFTDSLTINQPNALLISLDTVRSRPITCPGSNDGQMGVLVTGGNAGKINYVWLANFGDTSFVRNVGPGNYIVTAIDSRGCGDTLFDILMVEPPRIVVGIDPINISSCPGERVSIPVSNISGGNGHSYTYSINNGNIRPVNINADLGAGRYQLTFYDRKGCALDTLIEVIDPSVKILLEPDVLMVKYQTAQSFNLLRNDSIDPGLDFRFSIEIPQNGVLGNVQTNGTGTYTPSKGFSGREVIQYSVCLAACPNFCKTSSLEINVESPCGDRNNLIIPNVIYPTGLKGKNRYFYIEAIDRCPLAWGNGPHRLEVFNRWGGLVYRNDNYLNDWDGTNTSGQPLPEGTYYYLLDLGSVAAPVRGYVVIMR